MRSVSRCVSRYTGSHQYACYSFSRSWLLSAINENQHQETHKTYTRQVRRTCGVDGRVFLLLYFVLQFVFLLFGVFVCVLYVYCFYLFLCLFLVGVLWPCYGGVVHL